MIHSDSFFSDSKSFSLNIALAIHNNFHMFINITIESQYFIAMIHSELQSAGPASARYRPSKKASSKALAGESLASSAERMDDVAQWDRISMLSSCY